MTTPLETTLAGLWRAHRPASAVVPTKSHREPNSGEVRTKIAAQKQAATGAVPGVPTVPTGFEDNRAREAAEGGLDRWAAWQERAAILEYCGGLGRAAAETAASAELGYRAEG